MNRTTSRHSTGRSFSHVRATLTPKQEIGPSPGVWQSIRSILVASCTQTCGQCPHPQNYADLFSGLNLLLLFIPVSVRLHPIIFMQCSHATIVGSPFRLRRREGHRHLCVCVQIVITVVWNVQNSIPGSFLAIIPLAKVKLIWLLVINQVA